MNERLRYKFTVQGHPNIQATHVKTIEFTKEGSITERADCIIGVNANFEIEKIKQFSKKVTFVCSIEKENNDVLIHEFKCIVNPNFWSETEIVIRKSTYDSLRTFGFFLNKGANKLNRHMVELLKKGATMSVEIKEGWYSD